MIKIIWICILLIITGWIGLHLKHDPGYVLITYNHLSIEMTLSVLIISLILLFIIMHFSLLIYSWLKKIPQRLYAWNTHRKAQNAHDRTRQGLIEFSEGRWKLAQKDLIGALPNVEMPLINYLTAARAAQEMGDVSLRDHYLREAQHSMPDASIAVELTQAQLQLANQQWEQALATLKHVQDLVPNHPYVLKLLVKLYQEVSDWTHLIDLLPDLKRHHVLNDLELAQLTQQTYLNILKTLIAQDCNVNCENFTTKLPKTLKQDPQIIATIAEQLIKIKNYSASESLICQVLRKNVDIKLIELYGLIPINPAKLSVIEALLKNNPNNASICLCLGRLYTSTHLWGQAKYYTNKSLEISPSTQAYALLATLLEQEQDLIGACDAYRKGMMLSKT